MKEEEKSLCILVVTIKHRKEAYKKNIVPCAHICAQVVNHSGRSPRPVANLVGYPYEGEHH